MSLTEATPPPAHQAATRTRVVSSTLYSVMSYGVTLPIALVVSRFMLHRIGLHDFGVWAALTTIMSFGALLDLGINVPIIKYTAEYRALGRIGEVNALLSTAMLLYLAVSAVFVLGMALASGFVLDHLFHAGAHDGGLRLLYFAVVGGFAVSVTFSVLISLVVGLQRVDLISKINLAATLGSSAGIVIVLLLGWGVNGLAVNWLVTTGLTIVTNWIVAKRLFRPLSLAPHLFSVAQLKAILRFSTKVQVATLCQVLNIQVDRILISYALGLSPLGDYQLASRAVASVSGVSFSLLAALLPAGADIAASGDSERLHRLYIRASRYEAIVIFGLCAGVAGLAEPLVWAWIGPGYSRVAATMVVILAGYVVWLPNQVTTAMLNAIGRPEVRLRGDLAFLCLHLPLSSFLIWRFGYFGTVAGTSFALASTRLYIYVAGASALHMPMAELLRRAFLHPTVAALLALGGVIAIQVAGVPLSIATLLAEVSIFSAIYIGYLVLFGLDNYDRDVLARYAAPVVWAVSHLRRGRA